MKMLEEKLEKVRYLLAQMAGVSQIMLKDSIKALLGTDRDLAKNVIKKDGEVDKLDNEIEDVCFKILAIYNPRAFDLRFVISALRVSVDLERIGDSCVNIAKQVKHLDYPVQQNFKDDINNMANAAYDMVESSLKSFFNNDVRLALQTIKRDDYIDKMNKKIITKAANHISENPHTAKDGVSLIYVVRNIERIADHATNICEFVYFKETGKSIKHTYFDNVKEVLGNGEDSPD